MKDMIDEKQEFSVTEIKGQAPTGFSFKKPQKRFRLQKKHLRIGLGAIAAIILIFAAVAFFRGWFSFSKEKVELKVDAPAEISSGEELKFSVFYQNDNRVALKNTKLIIDYPEGIYSAEGEELKQEIVELERIPAKSQGVKDVNVRLTGEKGSIKLLTVRLNYQPENISSFFENSASLKIKISSVLIGLYLTIPQKAINGEEVSYILDYFNDSEEDFSDLKIDFKYPSGFSFKTAEPKPVSQQGGPIEGDNFWQLKELKKGERGTIKVVGILEGIEGENKTLEASISKIENNKSLKIGQTNTITQISASPLLVSLSINNSKEEINVSAGEKIDYSIEFKNNADIALSQLVLKVYLEGEVFDFKTLKLKEKGFFDSLNNVITWSAAGVSSLALLPPGESGKVDFFIYTNENFLIDSFSDKNFQISLRVELETVNVPPQFNLDKLKIEKSLSSKVNSDVVLQAKAYYNETAADIKNFGPISPQVDQLTTYTIHWQITNASNDLENVQVRAILPEGIEWRNVYTTLNKDTQLEYNERTKQLVWEINKLPAATGYLIPAYEIVFQIGLRPSITQVETTPVLIDESSLQGRDVFTGEILESFDVAISSELPDDPSVGHSQGRVVE